MTPLAPEIEDPPGQSLQNPGIVVVVLANADEHDVDTTAGRLVHAAGT